MTKLYLKKTCFMKLKILSSVCVVGGEGGREEERKGREEGKKKRRRRERVCEQTVRVL